jgi:hypothetical protein
MTHSVVLIAQEMTQLQEGGAWAAGVGVLEGLGFGVKGSLSSSATTTIYVLSAPRVHDEPATPVPW